MKSDKSLIVKKSEQVINCFICQAPTSDESITQGAAAECPTEPGVHHNPAHHLQFQGGPEVQLHPSLPARDMHSYLLPYHIDDHAESWPEISW